MSSARFPGRQRPPLDEHLVVPETTRDELVRGRRAVALPSSPPHGDRHFEVDYVVRAHIRPGYVGSTDMLTRVGTDSDFATDTSVRRGGLDPATGQRHLEELAIEVVHTQTMRDMIERSEELTARGVRRVFGIFVREGVVREWSAGARSFRSLDAKSVIEDPCLSIPLRVEALLNAAEADDAVARALVAKGNPVLNRVKAEVKAEGVLTLLAARGVAASASERAAILACTDLARLDRWLVRAASATSTSEIIEQP